MAIYSVFPAMLLAGTYLFLLVLIKLRLINVVEFPSLLIIKSRARRTARLMWMDSLIRDNTDVNERPYQQHPCLTASSVKYVHI